jgi:hypothetical protein
MASSITKRVLFSLLPLSFVGKAFASPQRESIVDLIHSFSVETLMGVDGIISTKIAKPLDWRTMETAPRDGSLILVRKKRNDPFRFTLARWNSDGLKLQSKLFYPWQTGPLTHCDESLLDGWKPVPEDWEL